MVLHNLCMFLLSTCPGFDWGRVNFLPSSRYSAVVWIYCENNVDKTLMFWLLLSSAYIKSRTFQPPLLCQRRGAQEAGREHSQDSWPKGYFIPYDIMLNTQPVKLSLSQAMSFTFFPSSTPHLTGAGKE